MITEFESKNYVFVFTNMCIYICIIFQDTTDDESDVN